MSIKTTSLSLLKIDESCDPVLADPGQIHQVLMNLITNACHAMENTTGTLEIGLGAVLLNRNNLPEPYLYPGRYVDLSVTDTGTGMEESIIGKIFDPFFTTKEVGKGTGLGLSVSYGIVRSHYGAIKVFSRPGQGSTFHVYLPVPESASGGPILRPAAAVQKGTEHILLVDDEQFILDLVEPSLKYLGYRVTSRTGSREALEIFRNNPEKFDLLITDMVMPNMTGLKLAGEIQKIRSGFPIIIFTGFSERINEQQAGTAGIKAVIMKPVVKDHLAAVIRRVLDNQN